MYRSNTPVAAAEGIPLQQVDHCRVSVDGPEDPQERLSSKVVGKLCDGTYVLSCDFLRDSSSFRPVAVVPSAVSLPAGQRLSSCKYDASQPDLGRRHIALGMRGCSS
jgi:hypothetical protein